MSSSAKIGYEITFNTKEVNDGLKETLRLLDQIERKGGSVNGHGGSSDIGGNHTVHSSIGNALIGAGVAAAYSMSSGVRKTTSSISNSTPQLPPSLPIRNSHYWQMLYGQSPLRVAPSSGGLGILGKVTSAKGMSHSEASEFRKLSILGKVTSAKGMSHSEASEFRKLSDIIDSPEGLLLHAKEQLVKKYFEQQGYTRNKEGLLQLGKQDPISLAQESKWTKNLMAEECPDVSSIFPRYAELSKKGMNVSSPLSIKRQIGGAGGTAASHWWKVIARHDPEYLKELIAKVDSGTGSTSGSMGYKIAYRHQGGKSNPISGGMSGQISMNPFFNPQFWAPLARDVKTVLGGVGKFAGNIMGGLHMGGANFMSAFGPLSEGLRAKIKANPMIGAIAKHMGISPSVLTTFAKFGLIAAGVTVALIALEKAIQFVLEGIKTGSENYKKAAGIGLNSGATYQRANAFNSIGVNPSNTEMMFNFSMQAQFLNMSKEFAAALQDAAVDARAMKNASAATMQESMDMSALTREWKTMWAQVAALLSPLIHVFLRAVTDLFKLAVDYLNLYVRLGQLLHLIPQEKNFGTMGMGGSDIGPTTSLEKMGFLMRGSPMGANNSMQNISDNSNRTVDILGRILNVITTLNPNTMIPSIVTQASMPQLP